MASLHLTKSRTLAGLQCLRRLWLLVHEPPDYEEPDAGSPLAMGHEIGRHAHQAVPWRCAGSRGRPGSTRRPSRARRR